MRGWKCFSHGEFHGRNEHRGIDIALSSHWWWWWETYYSAVKKNEMMPFAATGLDLEMIILSEISSDRARQISSDMTYVWD